MYRIPRDQILTVNRKAIPQWKKVHPDLILFLYNNLFHGQIALRFTVKNLIVWDSVHAMTAGYRESYFSYALELS